VGRFLSEYGMQSFPDLKTIKTFAHMEYIHQNNIQSENLDDFLLKKMGESVGVNFIIYGFASEYDIPFMYAGIESGQQIQRVSSYTRFDTNYWKENLLISLNNWAVTDREIKLRSSAAEIAGAYISLTYYSININNGEKKFLSRNETVLKKG
jgi:hypothetical protein